MDERQQSHLGIGRLRSVSFAGKRPIYGQGGLDGTSSELRRSVVGKQKPPPLNLDSILVPQTANHHRPFHDEVIGHVQAIQELLSGDVTVSVRPPHCVVGSLSDG